MDFSVISSILRDIVIRHNESPLYRLNSFVVINRDSDFLNTTNFGKNQKDYERGNIWVRNGWTPDDDCIRYGVLFLQKISAAKSKGGNKCFKVRIGIGLPETCESCDEYDGLTSEELDMYSEEVLDNVLEQFMSYTQYSKGLEDKVWLHPTQYEDECYPDDWDVRQPCNTIKNIIEGDEVKYYYDTRGKDNVHITSAYFDICGCTETKQKFDTCGVTKEQDYAIVKCDACG